MMRSVRWDVPFADRHPYKLILRFIGQDMYGVFIEVEAIDDRPGKWQVRFTDVIGLKCSNESYFDWTKWSDSVEASHQARAYIVEDAPWRDEFWNGRSGDVVKGTHYVISTGDDHFECLAGRFELFPSGFDPHEAHARFLASLPQKPPKP